MWVTKGGMFDIGRKYRFVDIIQIVYFRASYAHHLARYFTRQYVVGIVWTLFALSYKLLIRECHNVISQLTCVSSDMTKAAFICPWSSGPLDMRVCQCNVTWWLKNETWKRDLSQSRRGWFSRRISGGRDTVIHPLMEVTPQWLISTQLHHFSTTPHEI